MGGEPTGIAEREMMIAAGARPNIIVHTLKTFLQMIEQSVQLGDRVFREGTRLVRDPTPVSHSGIGNVFYSLGDEGEG